MNHQEQTTHQGRQMLGQEWQTLQTQYEQYERGALQIKLVAVLMCVWLLGGGLMSKLNLMLTAVFVLLLWLQEGIFRTSQARLGERILQLETGLRTSAEDAARHTPFQLHSDWQQRRGGVLALLMEYAKNAARPTVAFPYLALLLVSVLLYVRSHF
jgi:hypothetical protein